MMMNQMALMAQMATLLGMLNLSTGQIVGGFPVQQNDMATHPGGVNGHAFAQNSKRTRPWGRNKGWQRQRGKLR